MTTRQGTTLQPSRRAQSSRAAALRARLRIPPHHGGRRDSSKCPPRPSMERHRPSAAAALTAALAAALAAAARAPSPRMLAVGGWARESAGTRRPTLAPTLPPHPYPSPLLSLACPSPLPVSPLHPHPFTPTPPPLRPNTPPPPPLHPTPTPPPFSVRGGRRKRIELRGELWRELLSRELP